MTGRAHRGGLAALILLAACSVGTSGRSYPPAQGPAGAIVTLGFTDRRTMTGELLAVEAGSLLLLEGREVVRVALPVVQSGKAPKVSFAGPTLDAATRERLRLISRYPQGVSADLEARLLEAYGLTAVREVS
jgi:hypothetical protein